MNVYRQTPLTPQTIRLVHGAMATGVILFGIFAHFVLLPNATRGGGLVSLLPLLLGLSLAGSAASILFSRRVPRPSTGESRDSFWMRAAHHALIAWAPVEGAGILGVVVYSLTGSGAAIAAAGVAIVILVLLNPAYFERR